MTAEGDLHTTLDQAFRAAFLLTGSIQIAENAVLDGIAALGFSHATGKVLIVESVKAAIRGAPRLQGGRREIAPGRAQEREF
ncbi:MAG: hypothetical protein JWP63_4524 [Candidatus Solibacter sp.]|nr:hypothetical protein [Candidatus Solibacter sp.]